ncbi:O-antigen ligase family protein [Candidatus Poribacteria bacterium]|nr:O-antigen ligase family protein [Candidatus Poribacteria bacterium]
MKQTPDSNQFKFFSLSSYIGLILFILSLPFGYSTIFMNIGLFLVLIGWIGRVITVRRFTWYKTGLDLPIIIFLLLSLVACIFAPNPTSSSYGYFWKLLRGILLCYAVIHSGIGIRFRYVLIVFFIVSGISSALGVWYYINETRLGRDYMGNVNLEYKQELDEATGFSKSLRDDLRKINIPLSQQATISSKDNQNEWYITDSPRSRKYVVQKTENELRIFMIEKRLTGTFKMPNDLGAYLALSFPLVFGFFVVSFGGNGYTRITKWGSLGLGVIVLLMGINLVLTLTRAAWVSVAISITCIISYYIFRYLFFQRNESKSMRPVMIISTIFILFIVAMPFLLPNHIKMRLNSIIQQPSGFIGERPIWWKTSIELIQEYPITGIGMGRFRYEYQHNGPKEQYNIPYHAHNIYLHTAVEHGIPSLFILFWIIVIITKRVWGLRNTLDMQGYFWGLGIFLGCSGFFISSLIYGLADNIFHQRTILLFWFIVGIIFYIQILRNEENEKEIDTN